MSNDRTDISKRLSVIIVHTHKDDIVCLKANRYLLKQILIKQSSSDYFRKHLTRDPYNSSCKNNYNNPENNIMA